MMSHAAQPLVSAERAWDILPLEAVADYFGAPELYAFLCSSRRGFRYAASAACWQGWRGAWLEEQLPGHVHWRPAQDADFRQVMSCPLQRAGFTYILARGIRLYEARDFDRAVEALRRVAALAPRVQSQVLCRLADALYSKAMTLKSNAAIAEEAAAVVSSAETPEEEQSAAKEQASKAREAMALREESEALLEEAEGLYTGALAVNPKDSFAVNGLALFADCAVEKRRLLEQAVKLDEDNAYALANLGADLLLQDDRRALAYLERALAVNPQLFYARLFKCKALIQLGDLDGALRAAAEQFRLQPGDEVAQRLLAQLSARRRGLHLEMLLV